MANDERILELARAIRPYLDGLLRDHAEADAVDHDLALLLSEARGGDQVDAQILDRLRRLPALHTWGAAFLQHGLPPDVAAAAERSLSGLPGEGEVVLAPRFVCPHGDMVFYRPSVGHPIPRCPTHELVLRPDTGPPC
jgi:hypothetical protein